MISQLKLFLLVLFISFICKLSAAIVETNIIFSSAPFASFSGHGFLQIEKTHTTNEIHIHLALDLGNCKTPNELDQKLQGFSTGDVSVWLLTAGGHCGVLQDSEPHDDNFPIGSINAGSASRHYNFWFDAEAIGSIKAVVVQLRREYKVFSIETLGKR